MAGFTVQPLECAVLALLQYILRHHYFPLVGSATGIHLRQSTGNAFSWKWFLRFLLYHLDTWSAFGHPLVLLYAIEGGAGDLFGHFYHIVG
jgi:hypothetical protein